ncbi:hypothetical protein [Halostagnicola sp. A-GB9-2]|uniref:hypothetical protein n=1 Tax=Halostagnicola sp. A-GB9-2 TaxID=3048066 RepID=UPI0024BF2E7B|nr:hypothetical protein [Halostagnicola sp. A-GB9-2]MDJ1432304.1 hypothetical protein [Halostagnicola sp. A-GB9-2]
MVDDCSSRSEPPENGTTRPDAETTEDDGRTPSDELEGDWPHSVAALRSHVL